MARETEVKLKIVDLAAFHATLKRIGAEDVGLGRVFEENVIFDAADQSLAKKGQLLRIRTETRKLKDNGVGPQQRFVLTFKRPAMQQEDGNETGYKVREEIEVEMLEGEVLSKIFEGLGMRGWFRYEKYRTTYKLGASVAWGAGLLIEVDETPIGVFAELEGPPEAIDRAAEELGYSKKDYLLRNYLTLYEEDCRSKGVARGDMVFQTRKDFGK
jgi:adenylate cyclase class 2